MACTVPSPREPADSTRTITGSARTGSGSTDSTLHWYESRLGWAAVAGPPVRLLTGLRFDVLDLPSDAGFALLRRTPVTGPVALEGSRVRLLVAAGSADELPGLLDWLEWGGIALDLTAMGAGGLIGAPVPPGLRGAQGAARWLRPPGPGRDVEPALPVFSRFGERGGAPDLVRLVEAAATECHRARMVRIAAAFRGAPPGARTAVVRGANPGPPGNQPLAFS
ncbi:SCO3374 family protein [Streptomyces sp. NBC_01020]|uniref:SCO3374 family protein n=1 Tax=unclassified Streptomyces TaxID=2593676 RepID=UPI00324A3F79|nr:SCO3374 family protein [Streptomyces sp. NBC_01020]WSX68135.1 SCO3374 family protein [Streptomyces sp. NBC_00932]